MGRNFRAPAALATKNPALCYWPQLLRLLALAVLAGGFASVALEPGRAASATAALFGVSF